MKCSVCNVNEVVPLKNGTIPDCYQCTELCMDYADDYSDLDSRWDVSKPPFNDEEDDYDS